MTPPVCGSKFVLEQVKQCNAQYQKHGDDLTAEAYLPDPSDLGFPTPREP